MLSFIHRYKTTGSMGFTASILLFLQAFFWSKETFNVEMWNELVAVVWIGICFLIVLSKLIGFRYRLAAVFASILATPVLVNAFFRVGSDIGTALIFQSPGIIVTTNIICSFLAAMFSVIIIGDLQTCFNKIDSVNSN